MIFQTESIETARNDSLILDHYKEIALNQDQIPLDPDWERYNQAEVSGNLLCCTVRDGETVKDSPVIGYSVFFLTWHIHYNTTRIATNDVLYLDKKYRNGGTGIKLIKYSEEQLKVYGVDKVIWHIKFNKKDGDRKDFSPILERLGYEEEEKILTKFIGGM